MLGRNFQTSSRFLLSPPRGLFVVHLLLAVTASSAYCCPQGLILALVCVQRFPVSCESSVGSDFIQEKKN